jgi:hypothetical protein
MLAEPLQLALGRLAAGFEGDTQNVQCVKQAGHHVRRAAQCGDQFGAFLVAEAHGLAASSRRAMSRPRACCDDGTNARESSRTAMLDVLD